MQDTLKAVPPQSQERNVEDDPLPAPVQVPPETPYAAWQNTAQSISVSPFIAVRAAAISA
eukprot:CAMPEP_0204429378 /NCGR_PEP_ID=MMETSP0470-20130426/60155_1 /ASSEMBLY_ACC=CAM_ASM_000385 /TAXON_ID=2969 /ORGANISM="Oxyrrhis marina" /LENGTH=59 /DNA_ID=CAMNT_0051427405 /DNA_START=57 /DNA_END=233 /DNA_ORIENTATION=-